MMALSGLALAVGLRQGSVAIRQWETFTTADGLASNEVTAMAVGPDNSDWFAGGGYVSHYLPGSNPEWEVFTTVPGEVLSIAIQAVDSVWFGALNGGVSHYTPG